MAWATEDAKHYLAIPEEDYIEVQEVTFASRQSAMFIGFKNGKVVSPSKVIGREEARSIIHTTQTAIQRIIEVTGFGAHQIGTKFYEVESKYSRLYSAKSLKLYPSKTVTMLIHSASSGSRQTGLPARSYQYSALP